MSSAALSDRCAAVAAVLLTGIVPSAAAAKRADAAKRVLPPGFTGALTFSVTAPIDGCLPSRNAQGPPSKFQIFVEESLVRVLMGEETANWPPPEVAQLIAQIRSSAGTHIYVAGLADKTKTSTVVTRVKTFEGLAGDRWELTVSSFPLRDRPLSNTSILEIQWRQFRRPARTARDAGSTDPTVADIGWMRFCAVKSRDGADVFASFMED